MVVRSDYIWAQRASRVGDGLAGATCSESRRVRSRLDSHEGAASDGGESSFEFLGQRRDMERALGELWRAPADGRGDDRGGFTSVGDYNSLGVSSTPARLTHCRPDSVRIVVPARPPLKVARVAPIEGTAIAINRTCPASQARRAAHERLHLREPGVEAEPRIAAGDPSHWMELPVRIRMANVGRVGAAAMAADRRSPPG